MNNQFQAGIYIDINLIVPDQTGQAGMVLGSNGVTVEWVSAGGSGSGAIVETGSYSSPSLITSSIPIPSNGRARIFVKGSSGAVVDPTLANGTGTQELYILCVDNTNSVQIDSASNIKLSGTWLGKAGSELCLHWIPSLTSWLEAGRNEI